MTHWISRLEVLANHFMKNFDLLQWPSTFVCIICIGIFSKKRRANGNCFNAFQIYLHQCLQLGREGQTRQQILSGGLLSLSCRKIVKNFRALGSISVIRISDVFIFAIRTKHIQTVTFFMSEKIRAHEIPVTGIQCFYMSDEKFETKSLKFGKMHNYKWKFFVQGSTRSPYNLKRNFFGLYRVGKILSGKKVYKKSERFVHEQIYHSAWPTSLRSS